MSYFDKWLLFSRNQNKSVVINSWIDYYHFPTTNRQTVNIFFLLPFFIFFLVFHFVTSLNNWHYSSKILTLLSHLNYAFVFSAYNFYTNYNFSFRSVFSLERYYVTITKHLTHIFCIIIHLSIFFFLKKIIFLFIFIFRRMNII